MFANCYWGGGGGGSVYSSWKNDGKNVDLWKRRESISTHGSCSGAATVQAWASIRRIVTEVHNLQGGGSQ